jgi:hypothetical protein
VIEAVRVVFVTIVGPQVEVRNDLLLLEEDVENVFLKERIANLFERFQVELGSEMVENRVFVSASLLFSQNVETVVLVDVFSVKFGVFSESESNFLVKGVDEEVKDLVLVDFIVCLLGRRHTFSKQMSQLTSLVMY